jgi:hypothetical protein
METIRQLWNNEVGTALGHLHYDTHARIGCVEGGFIERVKYLTVRRLLVVDKVLFPWNVSVVSVKRLDTQYMFTYTHIREGQYVKY